MSRRPKAIGDKPVKYQIGDIGVFPMNFAECDAPVIFLVYGSSVSADPRIDLRWYHVWNMQLKKPCTYNGNFCDFHSISLSDYLASQALLARESGRVLDVLSL